MCPQKSRKSCANKWVSGKDGLGKKTSRQPGSGDPVGTRVAAEAESERARSRAAVSLPSQGREGHRPILRTSSLEKSLRPRQAVVPSGPVKAKARGAAGAAPDPGTSRRELAGDGDLRGRRAGARLHRVPSERQQKTRTQKPSAQREGQCDTRCLGIATVPDKTMALSIFIKRDAFFFI